MLETFPVVAVVGARQVGKTTMVQLPEIAAGREYRTLDDYLTLDLARKDPMSLVRSTARCTLDEVQRAPDLLLAVKREVDERRTPGRILLTGSADLNFTADLSRVLAGRVGVLRLRPLTDRELAGNTKVPAIRSWLTAECAGDVVASLKGKDLPAWSTSRLFIGGYPPAVQAKNAEARRLWFEGFRRSYLERDVRQLSEIGHLTDFARLLQLAATRTGRLLNQAALARDAGLSPATAGRYFSLMEATFQMERLQPYFANIGKRLVKSPKLYWTDPGLAAYLLGLSGWAEAVAARCAGALLETWAMMETLATLETYAPEARLYFFRSHGGLEIDGLIVWRRRLLPFEVKATVTLRADHAKNLQLFLETQVGARTGILFYLGREVITISNRIVALPVSAMLAQ